MRPLSSIPRYTAAWSAKGRHCCRRRVATAARPGPFSFVWHIALYVAQMAMDNCQWKLYDQKTIGTACLVRLWQWSLDGTLTQRIALFASVPGSRLYPAHIVVYTESKFRSAGPLFRTEWHCQSLKRPWALHKYVYQPVVRVDQDRLLPCVPRLSLEAQGCMSDEKASPKSNLIPNFKETAQDGGNRSPPWMEPPGEALGDPPQDPPAYPPLDPPDPTVTKVVYTTQSGIHTSFDYFRLAV